MKQRIKQNPRLAEGTFAEGWGFYKLFWIFLIGCIAGVVIENLYCLVTSHKLESRSGLIYGPFNPVYGFGAVFLTICLTRLRKRSDLFIFLCSMLLGGFFEFACSLIQEKLLGTVSWEYSGTWMNIAGRTNLMYAFFWGILGLVWVKEIAPFLSRQIERIPKRTGVVLTWCLVVFMSCNMLISAAAVARQVQRKAGTPPGNMVEYFIDAHYNDDMLKRIYPNMIIVQNH